MKHQDGGCVPTSSSGVPHSSRVGTDWMWGALSPPKCKLDNSDPLPPTSRAGASSGGLQYQPIQENLILPKEMREVFPATEFLPAYTQPVQVLPESLHWGNGHPLRSSDCYFQACSTMATQPLWEAIIPDLGGYPIALESYDQSWICLFRP